MNSKPAQYCSSRSKAEFEWIDSRLSHYVSKMTGSNWDIVLDFGCGAGIITKNKLLSHCSAHTRIIAVDIQSAFVDFAKETFGDERIEYMVLDVIKKTPSHWAKRFDKVFAFFSHHYISDFRKFLKVFREILKPEGYVICLGIASSPTFSVWLELSTKEEWKKYLIGIEKYIPFTHTSKDYCSTYKKLAEECGFVPIVVTSCVKTVTFDSEKQFMGFQECVLPEEIVKQIPLENFEKFLEDYKKVFKRYEVTYNTDGTVTAQHTFIEMFLQSES
ncbi:juvenile hormone acid O-methyltransferase-like isoform X2 [Tachypleus tridentatus]